MKSFYNKLNVIITVFFVLGILFSAFNLYNLPIELEKISGRIDLTVIKELSPVLNQTNFIVGLTLTLGLGSIIFALYLLNYNKTVEKIIYVEKTESQKKDEDSKEELAKKEDLAKQVKNIQSGLKDIKDRKSKYEKVLSSLCMKIDVSQGIMYSVQKEKNKRYIELFATFAYNLPESDSVKYEFGEGLAGQVAKEGKKINIKDIPKGYITIISGLGAASPNHLAILPIMEKGEVVFVVEIASFNEISESDEILIIEALKLEEVSLRAAKKVTSEKKADDKKEEKSK
ncbi:MAG: GAF domain-containing protein [Cyclobacteriaceae bacterium]|nr:GAF domain-containing protein [Cyclobacteriaceae bacterium]